VNVVEKRGKVDCMFSLFEVSSVLIVVISSLLAVSLILTSYCYLNARKKTWYGYLWKGFSLMSIGCMLILLGVTLNIPQPFNVMREVFILPLGIYGFSLIILGERKKMGLQLSKKDELTERIARNLSARPEQEGSRLYS
jgi:hypothetical protein